MDKKIVFIGGRKDGYSLLEKLIEQEYKISFAYIMKEEDHEIEKYSDKIKELCKKNKNPFKITKKIDTQEYLSQLKGIEPYLNVVLGWRTKISNEVLKLPKLGTIGVHPSLLPSYRGFCPLNWAIRNGEKKIGVTLFNFEEGIDSGDIIAQEEFEIKDTDYIGDVLRKAETYSVNLFVKYIPLLISGNVRGYKQNDSLATYTCSLTPEDGKIDWNENTKEIYNKIRATSYPFPGAFSFLGDKKIVIWRALIPIQNDYIGRIPGRIVGISEKGVNILTGDGEITIEEAEYNIDSEWMEAWYNNKDTKITKLTDIFKSIRERLR